MNLPKDVLKHWKLSRDPFVGELRRKEDVLLTAGYTIAELRLWQAIDNLQLAALVGEIGSGKSSLVARVIEDMSRNAKYRVVRIVSLRRKQLTATQVLDALVDDLLGTTVYSGMELKTRTVEAALEAAEKEDQVVVLVIDEAHELPPQTIRDLKKLHEIRGKFRNPLCILMIGQPVLYNRLHKEVTLKEVLDRLDIIELPGLRNRKEKANYLTWKFQKAGGVLDAIITPDGLDRMAEHPASRYPLGLNNLMGLALVVAQKAKEKQISPEVVSNVFFKVDASGEVKEAPAGETRAAAQ